jgi:tetratricopeptide (TPR) repeat protein
MDRTSSQPRLMTAAVALFVAGAALTGAPETAAAQDDRYLVLVPPFSGEVRGNLGRNVANETRRRLNQLATHGPFEGRELRDALRRFGLREEELSADACIKGRQLATQVNVTLVLCGELQEAAGGVQVRAQIINPAVNESFTVTPFVTTDARDAANQIVTQFENYIQVIANVEFCNDYLQSEQWSEALRTCERALAINPEARGAIYGRAAALYYTDRKDEALQGFKRVLEIDPMHLDALKFAGIISTEMGDLDQARRYFNEYLELNPGDDRVRLTIAQDMANAGDFEGALAVVEEGFEGEPDVDMAAYAGGLALQAAERRFNERSGANGELGPARPLYEKALRYLQTVFDARGAETDVGIVRNMLVAYTRLGQTQEAAAFGARATQAHPGDAGLWRVYAQTLREVNRLDDALAALDRAAEADPQAQVYGLKTLWLLSAGRVNEVEAAARRAVERGELTGDQIAENLAGTGYNEHARNNRHEQAITYYEIAARFAQERRPMVNFFHGYSLLKIGERQQEPGTRQSAERSLPTFQRAKQLLEAARGYQEQEALRQQLLADTNTFIEIQELLIRRGR